MSGGVTSLTVAVLADELAALVPPPDVDPPPVVPDASGEAG